MGKKAKTNRERSMVFILISTEKTIQKTVIAPINYYLKENGN